MIEATRLSKTYTRGVYALRDLSLRIDKIDHDTVIDLRHFLGPDFISLIVVPEGMAFMQLELRFGNSNYFSKTPML